MKIESKGVIERIRENASLQSLNTLGLSVKARYLIEVHSTEQLIDALRFADKQCLQLLITGEGSNLFFTGNYPGVVVQIKLMGIEVKPQASGARVDVKAGENWAHLVDFTVCKGYYGLENLSLIPGTAGAAPVQNIGAYGVQLEDVLHSVQVVDRVSLRVIEMNREDCHLGYRDSIFRQNPDRFVITRISLNLDNESALNISYGSLHAELDRMGVTQPTGRSIAAAVATIRKRRLPNPREQGNLGSFFKNPYVTARELVVLQHRYPGLPVSREGDLCKLSAAWLIDRCDLKGVRIGGAAVSGIHSLVLVNLGGATPENFLDLIALIRNRVGARFGVSLALEPRMVPGETVHDRAQ